MPKKPKAMTGEQLRDAIEKAGFANQQAFGRCIGVHGRTVQKWTLGESVVPRHIAMLINLMIDTNATPETLRP